ncbi:IS6 family transposase, partial [Escherichia coli]|uniref:IS6 family transposase n=1 Tax=Escherichia coli TaxID=562 RepID=UPI003FD177CD
MNPFKGRHFQRDIILWAVRWYCKYGISYRELQEMLAERGVNVDHSTIYRWVQRYAPEMEKRLRWYWRNPSDLCPWHMDETYVKVNGRWAYLYRAVDSRGGTVAKLAMRQPFVLFKGLTFQKLCLPGAFRPGDHHN